MKRPILQVNNQLPAVYFLAALIPLFFSGCDQITDWQGTRPDVLAEQAAAQRDYPQAVRFYESALDGTSGTAEVHFRLAIIYDAHLNDPVSALHHYRRFNRMSSDQSKKGEVGTSIARLEREMVARLGEGGLVTRAEAVRLRNENSTLRQQIAALRGQKVPPAATAVKPSVDAQGFSTVPQTRVAEQVVGEETRTYTVQRGDTLAAISRKFYNTSNRWKDIVDANHNQLQGGTAIREGQVLIIPQ